MDLPIKCELKSRRPSSPSALAGEANAFLKCNFVFLISCDCPEKKLSRGRTLNYCNGKRMICGDSYELTYSKHIGYLCNRLQLLLPEPEV